MSRRAASPTDLDWLYEVHRAAMRGYVEDTWGWDEAWQERHFREHFAPEEVRVVRHEDQDIGFLRVSDRTNRIVLESLELLPPFQRRGIGSTIIRRVLSSARDRRVPVVLRVLKTNTEARALYERLGFTAVSETETHHLMQLSDAQGGV